MYSKLKNQDIKKNIIKNCSDISYLAGILLMFSSTIIKTLENNSTINKSHLEDIKDISYMFSDITTEIDKSADIIANII